MQLLQTLLAAGLLASTAVAHPGGHDVLPSMSDIQRRSGLAKRCAGAVGEMNRKRWAKRQAKRGLEARAGNATFEIATEAPYYDVLQNDTCVLAPTVTEGPYVWPRSQTLRQDMTEGQPGIPMTLDVGVLDMATCEPLENVLMDFWHCNATGSYSSFTKLSPNTAFADLLEAMNITDSFEIGVTDLHTDDTTFLRGMWPTDSNGMMEMKTIVPGFYIQRSIHIHVEAHTDWVLAPNGTISSGNRVSTGQIYINETLSQQLMALEPYVSHTQINRTTNDEDSVFDQDTVGGYNPVIDFVAEDGVDVANGVIGYITIGIDTTDIQTGSISGAPAS
ncbi:probable protocatechuate 3,4-dioxygenase beta subunit [Phialocephala subalpina]|uniref:Probable protocatechuate 3,4-dioxygenase beta subunit n=1 Tax=Phialocephala subalpina TaxID=576137 RepID=A0A1L7XUC3_9HELO|nr:probable protocatechuate 3,4-dioxygenase beta subunit [Phialocephala subalpina]